MSTADHVDPAAPARPRQLDDVGVAELLSRLGDQFTTLVRQEVELVKAEARQELSAAAKVGASLAAAGLTGWFALLFVSLAAAWGLAEVIPAGLAFLVVGLVYAVIAAVMATRAKTKADELDPNLNETTRSLETTADWAKDKTS